MIPLGDNIKSRTFPVVNTAIIAACIALYILQKTSGDAFTQTWIFKPIYLFSPEMIARYGVYGIGLRVLASMFMHGSLLHIGGNMLFLWVFGDNVEDRMGHLRYLLFYLLCGVAATLAHSLVALAGSVLVGHAVLDAGLVGASGAIAGVLGAYYKLFKGAHVRTLVILLIFITFVDIPASVFIIFWFILNLVYMVLGGAGGGVAYGAHVGGFLTGYLLCDFFAWRPGARRPRPRVTDLRLD